MNTIAKTFNKCPKTNKIIPGHYTKSLSPQDIPSSVRQVSILIDKNNIDRLIVIDLETKVREVWFFHNGGVLKINNGLETYANFNDATIYVRSLGNQNYQAFLCSKLNTLKQCPDIENDKIIDKTPSFLDNLSYKAAKNSKHISNINIPKEKREDAPIVMPVNINPSKGFIIPKILSSNKIEDKKIPNNIINKPKWISPATSIIINGLTLDSGLLYIGEPNPEDSDWMMSPAIINLRSPVNMSQPDTLAKSIGYWPSYSKTTSEARAAYLLWLSSSRDNKDDPISWVFLFFFGLERRVILDNKKDSTAIFDFPAIKEEILRLRNIYGWHASFNKYSEGLCHLIDLLSIPIPEETLIGNIQDKDRHPWWLRIKLGKLARSQTPLPADLALIWAKTRPRFTLPKPAVRCSDEFDALFNIKYREKHDFGLTLPDLKQKLIFTYKPATAGLETISIDTTLPDVSRSIKVDNALSQLVQECSKELDKYSRFLAKNPESRGTLQSLKLLPDELLSEEDRILLASQIIEKKSSKKEKVNEIKETILLPTPVILDHKLIAIKEAETKEVSKLLHSILSDETPKEKENQDMLSKNEYQVPLILSHQRDILGLDEPHWILLNILKDKPTWTRIDFVSECKKLDIMPNGALDILNETSFAYANEPLTDEEEDLINIDQQILEELLR